VAQVYADERRAAEVIGLLGRSPEDARVDARHMAGLVRRTDWHVQLQVAEDLVETTDCACQFWKALLAAVVLTPGASSGRPSPAAFGLELSFEDRLGAVLPPGSSAVFMIVSACGRDRLLRLLTGLQGTLLTSPIETQPRDLPALSELADTAPERACETSPERA
jgi:uncharacterized membrane protein